jgi:ABC-2 type transport system permease protein
VQGGPGQPTLPRLDDPAMVRSVYGSGFRSAYIFALVLGIIGMAGEYRHQTITPTFLATPRRGRVVAAKLATYALIGLVFGVVTTAVAVLLGAPVIAAKGYPVRIASDAVPQTLGLAVLGVGVWAVFGLGLGTLIRNQVAAILVAVGVAVLIDPLLTLALHALHLDGVAKFLPGSASSAVIQGVGTSPDQPLLPWWGGVLVLLCYGGVFAALGAWLTRRRDIT